MKINLNKILLLLLTAILCSSCSSLKNLLKPHDPWNGRYLHHSGRFELILDHFMDEVTSVDQYELPHKDGQRPRSYFNARIKGDKAIFQSRDPSCRVELQAIEQGIILSNFCHGTNEDTGLYRTIE